MSDKLDRFTKRARHALTAAQEAARHYNHRVIGPEHLLLALAREEDSVAIKVLHELGVEAEQIVTAVESTIVRNQTSVMNKPMLADRTKRVIELAVGEAHQMQHEHIGTGHLLLGLLGQGERLAVDLLGEREINLDNVRAQMAHVIQQSQEE